MFVFYLETSQLICTSNQFDLFLCGGQDYNLRTKNFVENMTL